MLRIAAAMFPMFAFVALLACAKRDPVDDNAVAPSDAMVGDVSATGLAAPANAAAAEAAKQAALPTGSGLGWTYREAERAVLFGPPQTPAFSIQCSRQAEGASQLVFVRFLPPTSGANGTLSFTGNGEVASVPITGVTNPNGMGGVWRASVPIGDNARDVAETFSGPGPVNVSITGLPPLVVPASAEPKRVFGECLKG